MGDNSEAAHVFASQPAAAGDLIFLLAQLHKLTRLAANR